MPRAVPTSELLRPKLTPRQCDVLCALAHGQAQKEIAFSLGISERAVRFHIQQAVARLESRSCTEAVVRAVQGGLIVLDRDGIGEAQSTDDTVVSAVAAP